MGKVIVKNIRGMGWGARACLVAVFTMLATVLCLQMRDARDAQAAVAVQTQWAIIGTGSTSTLPTMTLAKGAGSNRLLVVKVVAEYGTAITTFSPTVSYGGQALTKIVATDVSSRQKVWFGYLNEAKIAAATGTTPSITVTWNSTPSAGVGLSAAFYSNVNQATPTTGSRAVASDTSATTPTSGTISVTAGGTAIYGTNVNSGYTSSLPANYTEHFDTPNSTLYGDAVGSRAITASGTENPLPTWTSARYGFAVIGLNPATTTLGTGVAGSSVNVAPGATAQKLGSFSLVTGSAGTTDSVTGLTVTTTNNAAIASMEIQSEAGTPYFTAVNNPGSDTWTFSGGTPIPVTNTAANYKIVANYKTRAAGAPAGLTATTARVSAITSGNVLSGSDTAETTLTLSNVHAASTWGTNSATSSSITLNWSYGTSGQSVVIVRYTANTDTTKPVDGKTYVAGVDTLGTGTVRYVGNLTTFTDNVGLQTGTTYYYKIFEYDSYVNYYNASDVWTGPLTLTVSDAIAPSVNPGFAAKTPVNTLAIPITAGSFVGTDNVGGSGVAGYLITTNNSKPLASAAGWTATAPTSYTVAAAGTYTLYPWVKDAAGNVSDPYGTPVTVVVDMTAPTVATFTVNNQTNSRNIPIGGITGTDVGTNVAAYLITNSNAQPAANAAGWSATAPTTYTVTADGTYTLYPWVKDAAGNVSALSGLTRTVQVDTVGPVLSAVSPADGASGQPLNVTLQASTATDVGVGNVSYYFTITDNAAFSTNSGWIASTSWAPAGLVAGTTYTWTVTARDGVSNPPSGTVPAPRTFTTVASCVRNDPTVTLLTPSGGVSSTISVDGGTSVYNLKVVNNDYGCGSTTFNLGVSDTDVGDVFDPPTLAVPSVTLASGAQTTTTVTVRATVDHLSGAGKTRAFTVADASHAAVTTGDVQTTLNVVGCTKKTPLLIVGPDSGYLNRGGSMKYTVSIKNTDSGTGCTPVTYNLAIPSETNSTDFNASSFSAPSIVLNSGQIGSVTLTVSAKATAAKNVVNKTTVAASASLHTAPANVAVSSTVNNPMLHNSDSTSSTKWSAFGGWGIPNARYGEFDCATCHVQGGAATRNVNRIRETVTAPDSSIAQFPGAGQPINYRRTAGVNATQPVPGWDSGATPRTSSQKICEICHTYDATGANGTKAHPFATTATLGNHFGTDGRDCIDCHKHGKGFSVNGMSCTGCHGTETETITPDNRYVVAPPRNASGLNGTISGAGNVSNDPKVGAHQTHLKGTLGFSNYSTIDYRCEACHGPIPTNFSHINSNSVPAFQGLATRNGAMTGTTYSGTKCNNTYCHNPAGTGGTLLAANVGTAVFPSWTSAKYVASGTKSVANCSVCHKVPGVIGFEPAGTHSNMNTDTYDCAGCHGHNGDASGTVAGKRHMDGIKWGSGNCDSCHGYGPGTWSKFPERSGVISGIGAHEKHIAYLLQRNSPVVLTPGSDAFGSGTSWTAVCGVCHNGASHNMGEAIPGTGRTISITPARQFGGLLPVYNGIVGTASANKPKTCSNVDCHYKETPSW